MKTNDLYVFQTVEPGVLITLIIVFILIMGYGLYRKMKLNEKERRSHTC